MQPKNVTLPVEKPWSKTTLIYPNLLAEEEAAKAEDPVGGGGTDPTPTLEPQRGPCRITDKVKPPRGQMRGHCVILNVGTAASIYDAHL